MVICVTGPMASGKNYICSQYQKEGWISKDADKDVHHVIETVTPQILEKFNSPAKEMGLTIQNQDGSLNRRELGKLLFSRPELLEQQEQLIYPELIRQTLEFIDQNKDKNIILNATLLYKTPQLLEKCQYIVYVKACLIKRIIRAKKRDGLPLLQILKRFKSQKDLYKKYKATGKTIHIVRN